MTNLELADKLQKEAEHFSGAQDLVGMLWGAGAALRNLHTENTALRVTEDNLRQELQECQDQRRAAFRRIEELEALRAQIGQGEPDDAAAKERDRTLSKLKRHDWHSSNIWRYYYPSSTGDWVDLRELRKLLAQFPTAPQQRPLLFSEIWDNDAIMEVNADARLPFEMIERFVRAIEAAHGIGEKK